MSHASAGSLDDVTLTPEPDDGSALPATESDDDGVDRKDELAVGKQAGHKPVPSGGFWGWWNRQKT